MAVPKFFLSQVILNESTKTAFQKVQNLMTQIIVHAA